MIRCLQLFEAVHKTFGIWQRCIEILVSSQSQKASIGIPVWTASRLVTSVRCPIILDATQNGPTERLRWSFAQRRPTPRQATEMNEIQFIAPAETCQISRYRSGRWLSVDSKQ